VDSRRKQEYPELTCKLHTEIPEKPEPGTERGTLLL